MVRKKTNNDLPTFDELLVPTIKALQELGGSGSIEEINSKVYVIAEIWMKLCKYLMEKKVGLVKLTTGLLGVELISKNLGF